MTRKATTYRIDPAVQAGLSTLSKVLRRPLNQLVNEAVKDFVERRCREVEVDLEATLAKLRAYRQRDPDFQQAIGEFIEAEASLPDPVEGKRVDQTGPVTARMDELLNA